MSTGFNLFHRWSELKVGNYLENDIILKDIFILKEILDRGKCFLKDKNTFLKDPFKNDFSISLGGDLGDKRKCIFDREMFFADALAMYIGQRKSMKGIDRLDSFRIYKWDTTGIRGVRSAPREIHVEGSFFRSL